MLKFEQAYDQEFQTNKDSYPGQSYHKTFGDLPYELDFVEVDIKMVTKALMNWFEQHPIYVTSIKGQYKIPVVYSSAQRFALMNNEKHIRIRDEHGLLMLPIISIKREDIQIIPERTPAVDKFGNTNITLYVREYIDYTTKEKKYVLCNSNDVANNMNKHKSVVEVIQIQAFKMFKYIFSISCWTKKHLHSNKIITDITTKFGQHHFIYYDENLFFGAYINTLSLDTNEEVLGNDEKIIKANFNITVEAPIITEDMIRRQVSVEKVIVDISESIIDSKKSKLIWSNEDPYAGRNIKKYRVNL